MISRDTCNEFKEIWLLCKEPQDREKTDPVCINSESLFSVEWLRESDGIYVRSKVLGMTIIRRKVEL